MRQFDVYNNYYDNAGHLLVGRVRFCNLDESPAHVYGLDNSTSHEYYDLGTVIYTDSVGKLALQVFLDNHDYLVFFDKYVGEGTMSEDEEDESWIPQGSAINQYNTLGIVADGTAYPCFGTIQDLKDANIETIPGYGDSEVKIVGLLGYNNPGDKPIVYYKWDPSSTTSDNGGSVIKATGLAQGRWLLIQNGNIVDSRVFGAFPNQTSGADSNQRNQLNLAAVYCGANSYDLYLYGDNSKLFYDISGLNINAVVKSDQKVRLSSYLGSTATMKDIDGPIPDTPRSTNSRITLTNSNLKLKSSDWTYDPASFWTLAASNSVDAIVFDATISNPTSSVTLNGKNVEFLRNVTIPGNVSFVDCLVDKHTSGTLEAEHLRGKTDVVTQQVKHPNYGTEEYNQFKLDDSGLSLRSTFTIGGIYTPKSASIYKETDGFKISLKYGSFDIVEVETLNAQNLQVSGNLDVTGLLTSTAGVVSYNYVGSRNGFRGTSSGAPAKLINGAFHDMSKSSIYNLGTGSTAHFWPLSETALCFRARVHQYSSSAVNVQLLLPSGSHPLARNGQIIAVDNWGLRGTAVNQEDDVTTKLTDTGSIFCVDGSHGDGEWSRNVGIVAPYTIRYFIYVTDQWEECFL